MDHAWEQWIAEVVNDRFPLSEFLGASEHSAVFLTNWHTNEGQKAAIKLVPTNSADAEILLARWLVAATVSHPQLIRLFEMGQARVRDVDLAFVVMEYAPENLSQVIPERPLTIEETSTALRGILNALGYLHSNKLVHGRLKPSNILAVDDQLKLSSDDIVAEGEPASGFGGVGPYDAPERSHGKMSASGDVWSLGMVLAEVLTGHLPAWESTGAADPIIPEGIPEPYAQLVRDCLHRDPARRPTIEAIRARLLPTSPAARQQKMSESSPSAAVPATELCSSTPPALQKPDGEARPEQRSPNQRFAMPAILVAVIFLAIVVGVWLVNRPSGNGPATQATVEQKQAESAMSTTQKPAAQPPSTQAESQPNAGAISSQPAPANKTNSGDRQGAVLRQVLPVVPEQAQSTITGTVRVDIAVAVDARGSVTQATLASAGPSHYFADRALEAARQWTFASPTRDGQPVPSQWKLRFEFRRAGIKALPQRTSPAS